MGSPMTIEESHPNKQEEKQLDFKNDQVLM